MRRCIRPVCGLVLLFLACVLYTNDDEATLLAAGLGVTAIVLLYREVLIAFMLAWWALRAFGRLLHKRAKTVEKMHHCACCGALPVYMVSTCASATCEEPIPDVQILLVCRDHHPNPEIGTKADELHAHIRKLHSGITIERIYPHYPY